MVQDPRKIIDEKIVFKEVVKKYLQMDELSKYLMILAIQQALWEMGPVEFDMVESKLKKDFQKTIEDSLENPIFLKVVLCELFGNAYGDILSSIEKSFKNVNMDNDLTNFIKVLKS